MADSTGTLARLLDALRRGDAAAQAEILARYQPWLRILARRQLDRRFQGKFDASDVVQLTILEAYRGFPQFRGTTEAELTAWLRQVLARVLAHEIRRVGAAAPGGGPSSRPRFTARGRRCSISTATAPRPAWVGLGAAARYDGITVRWSDGLVEEFAGGPADRVVVLRRGEGGVP